MGRKESIDDQFEMTERRRRPKVVPRAAADFVRHLKIDFSPLKNGFCSRAASARKILFHTRIFPSVAL